jgi:hypothetical protein
MTKHSIFCFLCLSLLRLCLSFLPPYQLCNTRQREEKMENRLGCFNVFPTLLNLFPEQFNYSGKFLVLHKETKICNRIKLCI